MSTSLLKKLIQHDVNSWLYNLNNEKETKPGKSSPYKNSTDRVKVLVAQLCPTLYDPWTVAHQAPLSIGFSR